MYWRRIRISDVPVEDLKAFDSWLLRQWQIKEALLEGYAQNGRFPADEGEHSEQDSEGHDKSNSKLVRGAGFIETRVQLAHWYDVGQIFVVLLAFALLCNVLAKFYNLVRYGTMVGLG